MWWAKIHKNIGQRYTLIRKNSDRSGTSHILEPKPNYTQVFKTMSVNYMTDTPGVHFDHGSSHSCDIISLGSTLGTQPTTCALKQSQVQIAASTRDSVVKFVTAYPSIHLPDALTPELRVKGFAEDYPSDKAVNAGLHPGQFKAAKRLDQSLCGYTATVLQITAQCSSGRPLLKDLTVRLKLNWNIEKHINWSQSRFSGLYELPLCC